MKDILSHASEAEFELSPSPHHLHHLVEEGGVQPGYHSNLATLHSIYPTCRRKNKSTPIY